MATSEQRKVSEAEFHDALRDRRCGKIRDTIREADVKQEVVLHHAPEPRFHETVSAAT